MPKLTRYRGAFDQEHAAHLARRSGFNASLQELRDAVEQGLDRTLDNVFGTAIDDAADPQAAVVTEQNDLPSLQALALLRMRNSSHPGQEKLALFWHGHFATSQRKVENTALMWQQFGLFRRFGLGSFREMLQRIARDPAMLIWLDGNSNHRVHPNENFARELMELFTLGVGHYDEGDVQEAARAFSGWHERRGEFWFNAHAHDEGEKSIFSRTGPWNGDDVLAFCLEHPACSEFLAQKLLRFYVSPTPTLPLIRTLAGEIREQKFQWAPVLRRLFSSREFFAPAVRRSLVKSPIELCVGTLVTCGARGNMKAIGQVTAQMGQSLFAPPSVKGWDGHHRWIHDHTLVARQRWASSVAFGHDPVSVNADWEEIHESAAQSNVERYVDRLVEQLHHDRLPPATQSALTEFARQQGHRRTDTTRELAHLVLSLPEYQLN